MSGEERWTGVPATPIKLEDHSDRHLPAGGDALTTAAAAEISVVVAAGAGSAESFAKSDHIHAINHAISDNHLVTIDQADAADNDFAKFTPNGLEGRSYAETLADLSGQATGAFDWNNQNLNNIKQVNMTDPTELTIVSGAITKTQGFHTVDTESDAATDYLDTINGGTTGDLLFLEAANTARTIIMRDGVGNIRLSHENFIKSYSFKSSLGSSGTYYVDGWYSAPAADANLTQASTTVTYGTANIAYGAKAFLVAAAAGTANAGTVSIVVSGTSYDYQGNRTAADSETLVANITTMTTNAYYETTKYWMGTVTYTLTAAGGAATYAADFNYGFAIPETLCESDFYLTKFGVTGRAGANDTGFNIILFKHDGTGWTYSATAFVPGGTQLFNMNTDYNTEKNLANGEPFAYGRGDLGTTVLGTDGHGIVIKVITTANNAVEMMNSHIGGFMTPLQRTLDTTNEATKLIYNGSYWIEPR